MLLRHLCFLLLLVSPLQAQSLQLHFLDVGQGDAAVIMTPRGRIVLIDAGPSPRAMADRLVDGGIDTLDLVIASHNHADHIDGMPAVLERIPVRHYLGNDLPTTTVVYRKTVQAIEARPEIVYLRPESRTIMVDSVAFRILAPPPDAEPDDQNNGSVGVLVEYRGFRALFTGDSEEKELAYWLAADSVPRVDVLKVAHHGSSNGTTNEWVERTRPAVAVVSVGTPNGYGHPSPGVLELWRSRALKVYRTDRDGDVTVTVDSAGGFVVRADRAETN